jgi:hypothetical protein
VGDEGQMEPEPEIDVRDDPFQHRENLHLGEDWEKMIRAIKVKEPKPLSRTEGQD